MTKRRSFSDNFKATVGIKALCGDKTVQQIAAQRQLHPTQLSRWKQQAIEGLAGVFSDKVKKAEHLAHQRHADLFIDTFNYNAHATSSDSLWAGLPVITKLDQGFAARVSGSLLKAVGLPELVTETEQDYEPDLRLVAGVRKLAVCGCERLC